MEQKINEENIENNIAFCIDSRKAFAIKSIPRSVFRNPSHKNKVGLFSISVKLRFPFGLPNQRQEMSGNVRKRVELVENEKFYNSAAHGNYRPVSPEYKVSCKEAATIGGWSSAWTMMAAASVIGCPIQSVYPTRNGILDKCVGILNTTFLPAGSFKNKSEPIQIMWTSTSLAFTKTWLPNHFVPLINNSLDILDIDSETEFPPLNSTVRNSVNPCPTIFDLTLDSRAAEEEVSEFEGNLQIQEPKSENRVDDGPRLDVHEYMDCKGVETSVSKFEGNLQIPKPNENQLHEIPTLESKENLTRETLIEMDVHESTRENATPVFEEDISANTHTPSNGQHLKFFDTIEILNKLLECTEILSGIYKGVKSNTWFVFDNSENIQKKITR